MAVLGSGGVSRVASRSAPIPRTGGFPFEGLPSRLSGFASQCEEWVRLRKKLSSESRWSRCQLQCGAAYSSSSQRPAPGNGRLPSQSLQKIEESSRPQADGIERYFATCAPGLEEIVAAELRSSRIGASRVQVGSAGVSFCGNKSTGVRANLWLRSAIRVLLELASGPLPRRRRADPVYEFVRGAADWPLLLVDDYPPSGQLEQRRTRTADEFPRVRSRAPKFRTFSVNSRVYDCEDVSNSMFASTRAKDAICDAMKDACGGSRPDPPADGIASADLPLFFSLYKDRGTLYRDMTGVSLHKRGYRDVMHRAGLNEAIAAGMLTIAGWNTSLPGFGTSNRNPGENSKVLMDPMCGSGTLLIEAALMVTNSAPGLLRSQWPFETWHDFDPRLLETCRQEAVAAEVPVPHGLRLLGNDIHEGALSLCLRDAKAANVLPLLELSCKDIRDYVPPAPPSLVLVNPPWGARLENPSGGGGGGAGDDESLRLTWQSLGRFLKSNSNGADVYVLSGNSSVTHALHMKSDKRWPITVGGIDCRVMHYYVLPPKPVNAAAIPIKIENYTT